MKKLNILFIANKSEIGGAPKSMMDLIIQLNKKCNIVVLTPVTGKIFDFCSKNKIKVIVENFDSFLIYEGNTKIKKFIRRLIVPLLFIRHKIINRIALKKIEKQINFKQVDLIHTNLHRDDIGGIIAKKHNIKHIVHLREFSSLDYKCISVVPRYINYINNYTDCFIAISNIIKEYYIEQGITKEKIKHIYNGIDTSKINQRKINNEVQKLKIIFVGNIIESKGQLIALQALNNLPTEIKKNVTMTFVGQIDPIYGKIINNYIEKNNLENIINIIEYAENIYEILSNYDVGLMCSKAEAFGRVTVEYMAAGLITIAPNTGANPEIIKDKVDGYIYNYNNINNLSELIVYIYDNINTMNDIRTKAIEKVNKKFTYKINALNIYNTYLSLTKKKGD